MKLPSIFKTAAHQKFEIKPRYYDPIKEELKERTERIKKELKVDDSTLADSSGKNYGYSIRGSFSTHKGINQRDSSGFGASSLIRTVLFFGMVMAVFGYIYVGPEIFSYMAYLGMAVAFLYLFFKLRKKEKNE